MLQNLKKTIPNIRQFSKSRLYHNIANLKKDKKINQTVPNDFKINCLKSNGYDKL